MTEEILDVLHKRLKVCQSRGEEPYALSMNADTKTKLSDRILKTFYKADDVVSAGVYVTKWTTPFGTVALLEDRFAKDEEIIVLARIQ